MNPENIKNNVISVIIISPSFKHKCHWGSGLYHLLEERTDEYDSDTIDDYRGNCRDQFLVIIDLTS